MTKLRIGVVCVVLCSAACAGGGTRRAKAGATGGSPAVAASGSTRQVEGRVEAIDRANHLTLSGTEAEGHAFDRLTVDGRTQVTVDGKKATLADVNPGDPVRASFAPRGDGLHVERLDVQTQRE
jgi:hypothetical protein